MEKLKDCTLENTTELFDLGSELIPAKLLSNYDGDTCRMAIEWKGVIGKITVRMDGYDSPEMKPALSNPNRDKIKENAVKAKEFLKEQLTSNEIVWLKSSGFDKYGRILGTIYQTKESKISVNQIMIDNNHGYVYNGGTKMTFL